MLHFQWLSHKNMAIFKRRAIFKILSTVFRRAYAFLLALNVFMCWYKNQLQFCPKTCTKEQPFIFCLFGESSFSNICTLYVTMECIELNWLCKHMKSVRSSQTSISIKSWTELSNFIKLVFTVCPSMSKSVKIHWN